MKRVYGKIVLAAGVAMLAGGVATNADALQLTLTDLTGGDTVTIGDDDVTDAAAGLGAIAYIGDLGSWTITSTTGLSDPAIGGGGFPVMDLLSVDASGADGDQLEISLVDTWGSIESLVPMMSIFSGNFWGTSSGTATMDVYVNDVLMTSIAGGGLYGFNDWATFSGDFGMPDTPLEILVTVDLGDVSGIGGVSFDANVAPVPEPATIMLVGAGLVGIAGLGRRRLKKGEAKGMV